VVGRSYVDADGVEFMDHIFEVRQQRVGTRGLLVVEFVKRAPERDAWVVVPLADQFAELLLGVCRVLGCVADGVDV
jgi:hypothetical protein